MVVIAFATLLHRPSAQPQEPSGQASQSDGIEGPRTMLLSLFEGGWHEETVELQQVISAWQLGKHG